MPSLEFTLMVGCPLMCTFCPQDNLKHNYGKADKYFTLENFNIVLNKLPKHVRVDFSGMAEPWANPQATPMLQCALESGYRIAIYSTLYGMSRADCITTIDLLRRYAKQVEIICLHLPDDAGNMRGWRYSEEYDGNLKMFLELAMERTLPFEAMCMSNQGQVHNALAHYGIKLSHWIGHTRAGNVDLSAVVGQQIQIKPQHKLPVSCSFTRFFDQNVILPNGDVVLCCMDYGLQHKIGNLLQQDYYEMFAADGIAKVVAMNMRTEFHTGSLCKSCNRAVQHDLPRGALIWQPN